jgi:hypothetical protein
MRTPDLLISLALLTSLSACVSQSVAPVLCGQDSSGQITILAETIDGGRRFYLRVPADWREQTHWGSDEGGAASDHVPLTLHKESAAEGLSEDLLPTEEEWFLREDLNTGALHVMVKQAGRHVHVGTTSLPTRAKLFSQNEGGSLFELIDFGHAIGSFLSDDDDDSSETSGLINPSHPPD